MLCRELVDPFFPVQTGEAASTRAQRFLAKETIAHPTLQDVSYDDGWCWVLPLQRSRGRYQHGTLFLADWHDTVLTRRTSSERLVKHAGSRAADLLIQRQVVVADHPDTSMAFNDETTAQRLMQLSRHLDDHNAYAMHRTTWRDPNAW